MVVPDVGDPGRLGLLADKAGAAGSLVVAGHDLPATRFGTHRLLDVTVQATAVLVEKLLRRLGAADA